MATFEATSVATATRGDRPSTRGAHVAAHGRARDDWQSAYIRLALGADLAVALAASVTAYVVRFGLGTSPASAEYVPLSLAFPLVWVLVLMLCRAYEPRFLFVGSEEYRRVMNSGLVAAAAVGFLSYAAKIELSRGYVVALLPLVTVAGVATRHGLRKRLHRMRREGQCMRRVVVVGYERMVANLVRQLRRERFHGMEVVGACLPPHRPTKPRIVDVGVDVYGSFDDIAAAVEATGADTVAVLSCPEMDSVALRRLAWRLEKGRTDLVVATALMDVAGPRTTIRPVDGLPMLHVEHPQLAGGRQLVKAVFDRVVALVALVVLLPLLVAIAVTIRVTSHGPAFFRQVRVGKDGRPFVLYKYRSMTEGAEDRQAALAALNEHDGVMFKIRHDPRVTGFGGWLRRYSLDELPQLANVLRGDMSLVGPRPPLAAEVEQYADDVRRRLVVKPGITGLWQVSGRSDLSWEDSVRLDLRYVENWSLALDLVIVWRTLFAVVKSSGAY